MTRRRKYFSSLERLRIAEHSGLPYIRAADSQIPSITGHRRTRTATSALAVQKPGSKSPNRLRKSHALPEDCKISQAEAQWFVSLPDKVRRRYFSSEEQVLLAARCETVLLDAADEALQQVSTTQCFSNGTFFTYRGGFIAIECRLRLPESEVTLYTVGDLLESLSSHYLTAYKSNAVA